MSIELLMRTILVLTAASILGSVVCIVYTRHFKVRCLSSPPTHVLRRFAEICFSKKTFTQVFEPHLSNMQTEYFDALAVGRTGQIYLTLARGYWEFWSAVLAQLPISLARCVFLSSFVDNSFSLLAFMGVILKLVTSIFTAPLAFASLFLDRNLRVSRAPGWTLRHFAKLCFSKKTCAQILEPCLSDMQDEHFNALAAGRPWQAHVVLVRGYWEFWSAVVVQLPISLTKLIYEKRNARVAHRPPPPIRQPAEPNSLSSAHRQAPPLEHLCHYLQALVPMLYAQVLEPTLADIRQEHFDAIAEGRPLKARRVLLHGYGALAAAAIRQLASSLVALWRARNSK